MRRRIDEGIWDREATSWLRDDRGGPPRRHSAWLGGPVSALARHFERERRSHADTTAEILAERLSRMIEFPGEVDKAAPLWAFRVRMARIIGSYEPLLQHRLTSTIPHDRPTSYARVPTSYVAATTTRRSDYARRRRRSVARRDRARAGPPRARIHGITRTDAAWLR